MSKVIGIDLGTTNSVAAVIRDGKPEVIPSAEGCRVTPSVVALADNGTWLVGQLAKSQAIVNPERTVASIKRRMGSDYKVRIDDKEFTPQEISGLILSKIKADAQSYLGEQVDQAVITVPAYFNGSQRQATTEAGIIAGLDVIRIINEPTASALAYGLDKEAAHNILVWDLGGGTFDVSILELGKGIFEVKAVNGDTSLGGDDWDQRIVDYLAGEFRRRHGIDLSQNRMAWQWLKEAAEKAKIKLSTCPVASIGLPYVFGNGQTSRRLETVLTRGKFEMLTHDLLQRLVAPTRQALADAGLTPRDIDRVILVGLATKMPAVQQLCLELLGKEPYKDVDPEEVVAIGAAIQAGILSGEMDRLTLLDVIPLSLGIETRGGLFAKIIPRNTKIPTSSNQIFSTSADNQIEVDIHVLQGEREMACANISLGRFQLMDISPSSRGTPRIEVTFDIDANGMLEVHAQDLYTEAKANLRIQSSRLSSEQIGRMAQEAMLYAKVDKKHREAVETAIKADNLINFAEKLFEQTDNRLGRASQEQLETTVLAVKSALASGKNEAIEYQSQRLQELIQMLLGNRSKVSQVDTSLDKSASVCQTTTSGKRKAHPNSQPLLGSKCPKHGQQRTKETTTSGISS